MRTGVSFVIPCLNEERTLERVLQKINKLRSAELRDRPCEVIVVDNGSIDRSPEIARNCSARVELCPQKGYGAALKCGIFAASHPLVIFADADDTYDFGESPKLITEIEKGYDLVLGTRIKGAIQKDAMPLLHRYLGTPALTGLINILYGGSTAKITDCNSGFRCFSREAFLKWGVHSDGMEFASEMLVKAMLNDAKISEVPITLHAAFRDRAPHLKTWRDGMRHLLQILLEAPKFFHILGGSIFLVSCVLLIGTALFRTPVHLGAIALMGIHTASFACIGSFLGLTLWGIGPILTAKRPNRHVRIYETLVNMPEDRFFWLTIYFLSISLLFVFVVILFWAGYDFKFLPYEKETVILSGFITNGILLIFQIFTAHLIKRT